MSAGKGQFPHWWAVMFLVAVGFWNFLGAGIFGFLVNLPMVSYYQIGTQLTANHAHASFIGVYVMLAMALLFFAPRYLIRPEDWSDRLVAFSFWTLNLGLAWMIFFNLFPLGVLQLGFGCQRLLARPVDRVLPLTCDARMVAVPRRRPVHRWRRSRGLSDGQVGLPPPPAAGADCRGGPKGSRCSVRS